MMSIATVITTHCLYEAESTNHTSSHLSISYVNVNLKLDRGIFRNQIACKQKYYDMTHNTGKKYLMQKETK